MSNDYCGCEGADSDSAARYHARDAIRYIHRRNALKVFKKVVAKPDSVPLEIALGALELFQQDSMKPDLEDLTKELDELATQFLSHTPKFKTFSVQEKAQELIMWMWSSGFWGAAADRYRALKNTFIGMSLKPGYRTSIPLTLVTIFIALARRVGFTAHACSFPGMMYARVDSADGTPTFYDIFNKSKETCGVVSEAQLAAHSILVGDGLAATYRRPARTLDLVLRMASNIIHTLQLPTINRLMASNGYPPIYETSAMYAAVTAIVILNPNFVRQHIVPHLTQSISNTFPMDVRFLEEELLPCVAAEPEKDSLRKVCNALRAEDSTPKTAWRRDNPETCGVEVCPTHSHNPSGKRIPHTWIPPAVHTPDFPISFGTLADDSV